MNTRKRKKYSGDKTEISEHFCILNTENESVQKWKQPLFLNNEQTKPHKVIPDDKIK